MRLRLIQQHCSNAFRCSPLPSGLATQKSNIVHMFYFISSLLSRPRFPCLNSFEWNLLRLDAIFALMGDYAPVEASFPRKQFRQLRVRQPGRDIGSGVFVLGEDLSFCVERESERCACRRPQQRHTHPPPSCSSSRRPPLGTPRPPLRPELQHRPGPTLRRPRAPCRPPGSGHRR